MADKRRATFTQAVERFTEASAWLGDVHAPAVATLWALAKILDSEVTPAMAAQYGLTYRSLAKLAPTGESDDDPIEKALRAAGA